MAQTEGKIGFGTLIGIGDGASPEVFTTIGEMFSIDPIGADRALVDFTHHESPDTFKEFKVGVKEGREISISANWVVSETGQEAIRTAFDAGEIINFEVTSPDTDETATFPGILTKHDVDRPLENRQVFNFSVKIAGAIVYT